jgi:hypothetical protein
MSKYTIIEPSDRELVASYKAKVYRKQTDLITDAERAAHTEYHKRLRHNRTPEQQAKAKLTYAKYNLKRKTKKLAEQLARSDVELGFDSVPFDSEAYDQHT